MKPRVSSANRVRIGAGEWRSRVLRFPDVPGLRPTSDRVRATLFNWLGQSLQGKVCLDAFAGSGALGFEAASRGAARVLLCESSAAALAALRANAHRLQATHCEIIAQDVLCWMRTNQTKFDVVFCDPPFAAQLHGAFLDAIADHLSADGQVYIESDQPLDHLPVIAVKYQVVKSAKAGAVFFGLLRRHANG